MRQWFRRRSYGYGWTPDTWEGWLVILVYILLFLFWAKLWLKDDPEDGWKFIIAIAVQTGLLLWISHWKGGSPQAVGRAKNRGRRQGRA